MLFRSHRSRLNAVAQALLERETLVAEEFIAIFEGKLDVDDLPDPLAAQPA